MRKEMKEMKLIPIGLCDEDGSARNSHLKAEHFSNDLYEGIQLRQSKKGTPVIISKSKRDDPLKWRVAYGFSQVYFRTFDEAVEFCNSRGMEIMKGQVE